MKLNNTIIIVIIAALLLFTFADKKEGAGTTVVRTISPSTINPGTVVTVTLTVNTVAGDKAITIHDESPYTITGTSSNIFEAGRIHATQLTSFTETYSFQVPSSATAATKQFTNAKFNVNNEGDRAITGTSSFDIVICSPNCALDSGSHCVGTTYNGNCGQSCTGTKPSTDKTWTAFGTWSTCTRTSGCSGTQTHTRTCQGTITCGGSDLCTGLNSESQSCTITSSVLGDTDCDSHINWTEINAYIGEWLAARATWTEINNAIGIWLQG